MNESNVKVTVVATEDGPRLPLFQNMILLVKSKVSGH